VTSLSLSAGVGGFDLALERIGMGCVGQVTLDPVCPSMLARHVPELPRFSQAPTPGRPAAAPPPGARRPHPTLDAVEVRGA
jgi:DNA (cytosine-5)-methyltransferase 1